MEFVVGTGRGAPVVLLHGLGGDGSRWAPNIGPLAADFRVIALDEIGFGQSDKPLANYHVGMLSEFLADFLKAIGVSKASLVGNSMGGFVAAYTAVHYPNSVDRLVLVDGAGYRGDAPTRDPHTRQITNGVTREETREWLGLMFHDHSLVRRRGACRELKPLVRLNYTGERGQNAIDPAKRRRGDSPKSWRRWTGGRRRCRKPS
jgi:2-hydroxy-6-oxonona-2,4-dienedioate hydrolase